MQQSDKRGGTEGWKGLLKKARAQPALLAALGLIIFGVLFSTGLPSGCTQKVQTTQSTPEERESDLEERLAAALSTVSGAGRVTVLVVYDSSDEQVPATVKSADGVESELVTVTVDGDEQPVILYERMGQVRGVLVLAEGAGDVSVRLQLQQAVMTLLQIPAKRVEVLKMEK